MPKKKAPQERGAFNQKPALDKPKPENTKVGCSAATLKLIRNVCERVGHVLNHPDFAPCDGKEQIVSPAEVVNGAFHLLGEVIERFHTLLRSNVAFSGTIVITSNDVSGIPLKETLSIEHTLPRRRNIPTHEDARRILTEIEAAAKLASAPAATPSHAEAVPPTGERKSSPAGSDAPAKADEDKVEEPKSADDEGETFRLENR